jgi:phosphate/sulfate permease
MTGDRGKRGGGLNKSMVWRIVMAWLVTVPVTIAIAAGLFSDPLQVRSGHFLSRSLTRRR